MTKTMTVPLFARIDTETNAMLLEMAKNSDKAKVIRQAIQNLYNNPIVSVPLMGKLNNRTHIDPCNEIENRQAVQE